MIWDGSTWVHPLEYTMNQMRKTRHEAPVTFGAVYLLLPIWIWQLRISFPNEDTLLAFINISACFCFPRICNDLVGAFSYMIGPWFMAANVMVFGSTTSASSWEPFRQAIAALAERYFTQGDLVAKYQNLLDMITWNTEVPEGSVFVQATADRQNLGIINEDGTE